MNQTKKTFIVLFSLLIALTLSSCSLLNYQREQKIENNLKPTNDESTNDQEDLADYKNREYNFSFKYPKDLKIKSDGNNIDEFSPSYYWRVELESNNFNTDKNEEVFKNIISGYRATIDIDPETKIKDFEELKMLSKLGSGGTPVEKEEYVQKNGINFIVQYHEEDRNKNVSRTVFSLFNGLFFRMNVYGEYSEERNIDNFINKMVESFSV